MGCLRSLAVAAVSLSALVALPAPAAAEPADDAPSVSLLFALHAESGTLKRADGDFYALTLRGVSAQTTVFSDRPVRLAANAPTRGFVDAWGGMFADSAPNAAVDLLRPKGGNDLLVLTLGRPRLNGDVLRFDARLLGRSELGDADRGRALPAVPQRFRSASVFIDDVVAKPDTSGYCIDGLFISQEATPGADPFVRQLQHIVFSGSRIGGQPRPDPECA